MKNWMLPLAVLGVSGLGLVVASQRGRQKILTLLDRVAQSKDPLGDFGKVVDDQLEHIQRTLDHLSQALEGH